MFTRLMILFLFFPVLAYMELQGAIDYNTYLVCFVGVVANVIYNLIKIIYSL